MLNSSNNLPEQQYRSQPLQQLIHNHPFVFWGGLWATVILVGGVATFGLFSPGPLEQDASKPTPTLSTIQESIGKEDLPPSPVKQKASEPTSNLTKVREFKPKEGLPFWLLGAIVLGCTSGCFLIAQSLKPSTQPIQVSKRAKANATPLKKRRYSSKKRRPATKTPQPVSSALALPTQHTQNPTPSNTLAQVTVLPPEESNPLDSSDENLAELLDIRKRQSLTSLMHWR